MPPLVDQYLAVLGSYMVRVMAAHGLGREIRLIQLHWLLKMGLEIGLGDTHL